MVYKVDRLTRSLADFAKLVELFDAHGVSFVSVTQSFNTTSSMGRLTLNVLLSFAQFEREVIGERVRDKIAASKRKGLWVGGPLPLGYGSKDKVLFVMPEEAAAVRTIFERYLALKSIGALVADLRSLGITSRGGGFFGVGALAHLLRNRFYIGEVVYRGEVHSWGAGGDRRPRGLPGGAGWPRRSEDDAPGSIGDLLGLACRLALRRSRQPPHAEPHQQTRAALPLLCLPGRAAEQEGRRGIGDPDRGARSGGGRCRRLAINDRISSGAFRSGVGRRACAIRGGRSRHGNDRDLREQHSRRRSRTNRSR